MEVATLFRFRCIRKMLVSKLCVEESSAVDRGHPHDHAHDHDHDHDHGSWVVSGK
jgi:ABC-type Zn2+ transport system substrate-binding protein/surface adhesin